MRRISDKYGSVLICVLLAAVTVAVYWPIKDHEFINYDDNKYVSENPHVKVGLKWQSVKWAFTTGTESNWHPVTWLSHILDVELFGFNAGAHHLVNLFFHIANSLLLFLLLKYMTSAFWPAAFVAALFALHPLHIESVAWVAERKDVLSTFLGFLALFAWVRYIKCHKLFWYICALLLFAVGLMAKPMLVTLPFLLLLLDYWPLERLRFFAGKTNADNRKTKQAWGLIVEKIPFFTLAAASSVVTFFVQRAGGAVKSGTTISFDVRLANAAVSYLSYIFKTIYPSKLAVFYPHPLDNIAAWKTILYFVLLILITIAVIFKCKQCRYLITGWLWYVGTLVPVIGLVQVGNQAMADRYTYLPLTGIFIMIAWGIAEFASRWKYGKSLAAIAAGTALGALMFTSRIHLSYWQNSITLFERALAVTKNNFIAYHNLGVAYKEAGRYEDAIESYKQAMAINPRDADVHSNLGVAYSRLGRYNEALAFYQQAVRIKPNYAEAYYNLGFTYSKLGRYQDAIESYRQAIIMRPNYADAYNNLTIAYGTLGRYQEAIDSCMMAIRINPDDSKARTNLAVAYIATSRYQEAIESCKQAVKIDPLCVDAYTNLGVAYGRLGRYEEAVESCKQAIKLNPANADAHYNLGVIYSIANNKDLAIKEYEILKNLDVQKANELFNLLKK